jgi:hypothetical protein
MVKRERMTSSSHSLLEESPSTLVMSANDDILQKRFEKLTEGMSNIPRRKIAALSEENKVILADFLQELTFRDNLTASTRALYVLNLCYLLEDVKGKPFRSITAQEIELYLQGHYRPVSQDPKQKWISTHNIRCIMYLRFFKWLNYPQVERKERPKPDVVRNIHVIAKLEATNEDERAFDNQNRRNAGSTSFHSDRAEDSKTSLCCYPITWGASTTLHTKKVEK